MDTRQKFKGRVRGYYVPAKAAKQRAMMRYLKLAMAKTAYPCRGVPRACQGLERRSRGRPGRGSTKERILYPDDVKSATSIARLQNPSKTPVPSNCPSASVRHIPTVVNGGICLHSWNGTTTTWVEVTRASVISHWTHCLLFCFFFFSSSIFLFNLPTTNTAVKEPAFLHCSAFPHPIRRHRKKYG